MSCHLSSCFVLSHSVSPSSQPAQPSFPAHCLSSYMPPPHLSSSHPSYLPSSLILPTHLLITVPPSLRTSLLASVLLSRSFSLFFHALTSFVLFPLTYLLTCHLSLNSHHSRSYSLAAFLPLGLPDHSSHIHLPHSSFLHHLIYLPSSLQFLHSFFVKFSSSLHIPVLIPLCMSSPRITSSHPPTCSPSSPCYPFLYLPPSLCSFT